MCYLILIGLLFTSFPVLAQDVTAPSAAVEDRGILIHNIVLEGFVLGDKNQFTKLFKPYRNKHLTRADMDAILQEIQHIYEEQGYQQLVSISYQVIKHRLVFTALMTS